MLSSQEAVHDHNYIILIFDAHHDALLKIQNNVISVHYHYETFVNNLVASIIEKRRPRMSPFLANLYVP